MTLFCNKQKTKEEDNEISKTSVITVIEPENMKPAEKKSPVNSINVEHIIDVEKSKGLQLPTEKCPDYQSQKEYPILEKHNELDNKFYQIQWPAQLRLL